jgi:hypothetical protein
MSPGGGGGMPDGIQWQQGVSSFGGHRGQQTVDQANMDLRRAQIMGADPMVIARLEQTAMQMQREYDQAQQEQYATQMGQLSQPSRGSVSSGGGGGPGPSQLQQNPYLQMLIQSQLGMSGGGRGSESYGRGGMPGSY